MEDRSSCSLQFRRHQMKTASALNVANNFSLTRCRCQTIGCPLPIIVEAQSSRQVTSVPRMYPQFGKAAIQPIDTKENVARSPYSSHDSLYFRPKASGNLFRKNLNTSTHLQSHKPVLDHMHKDNSKNEQRPNHAKLAVTCKAPTNWLRMKLGRV